MTRSKLLTTLLLIASSMTTAGQAPDSTNEMILFEDNTPSVRWMIVNDTVMGGVSSSKASFTESGVFTFTGNVSFENNGGFASVRSEGRDWGLEGTESVKLKVRGDGQIYQLRFRTNNEWDGVSYSQEFVAPESWTEVTLPIEKFIPLFRGRVVSQAPSLDPELIRQVGFMVSNKQEGEFKLEVDWVGVQRAQKSDESKSDAAPENQT